MPRLSTASTDIEGHASSNALTAQRAILKSGANESRVAASKNSVDFEI
jgi:hypothetical protein